MVEGFPVASLITCRYGMLYVSPRVIRDIQVPRFEWYVKKTHALGRRRRLADEFGIPYGLLEPDHHLLDNWKLKLQALLAGCYRRVRASRAHAYSRFRTTCLLSNLEEGCKDFPRCDRPLSVDSYVRPRSSRMQEGRTWTTEREIEGQGTWIGCNTNSKWFGWCRGGWC